MLITDQIWICCRFVSVYRLIISSCYRCFSFLLGWSPEGWSFVEIGNCRLSFWKKTMEKENQALRFVSAFNFAVMFICVFTLSPLWGLKFVTIFHNWLFCDWQWRHIPCLPTIKIKKNKPFWFSLVSSTSMSIKASSSNNNNSDPVKPSRLLAWQIKTVFTRITWRLARVQKLFFLQVFELLLRIACAK